MQLDSIVSTQEASIPQACVVLDAKQNVVQLNTLALHAGVSKGMKLGTASALIEPLQFHDLDMDLQYKKLNALAAICYDFSSDVVVRSEFSCLLIEFSGLRKLYRSVSHYLQSLDTALQAEHIMYEQALAPSPLLAELLARFSAGTCCRPASEASALLEALPVECLDTSDRYIQKLQRLGLTTVGEVKALPKAELAMRLGDEFVAYLQGLSPTSQPILARFSPPECFSMLASFDAELHVSTALLFPSKRLFDGLERYLRQRSLQIQEAELQLLTRNQKAQCVRLFSAQPELSADHWQKLLRLKLETVRLDAPVLGMALSTGPLLKLEIEASDLFDRSVSARSIASTLSKLEARLGEGRLRQPVLQDSHVPESSVEYCRVVSPKDAKQRWRTSEPLRAYAQRILRPSLLLKSPEPLYEMVRVVHGPERVQSAWWEDTPVCRDYFVAINARKQTLWVFRDHDQHWFVHGVFA